MATHDILRRCTVIFSALFLLVSLNGCSLLLTRLADDQVAQKFPPKDHSQALQEALTRSAAELAQINNPALLLNAPPDVIRAAFQLEIKKFDAPSIHVVSATVRPSEQGFYFSANIDGVIDAPSGHFNVTLTGWSAIAIVNHEAQIQPILESAVLNNLHLDHWSFASRAAADAINALLARYINNVNGQIPMLKVPIDSTQIGLSGVPTTIDIGNGRTVTLPGATLGASAVLVDTGGIHLVSEITSHALNNQAQKQLTSYTQYANDFWSKADLVRPGPHKTEPGLFLSSDLLTRLLAPAFPPIDYAAAQQLGIEQTLGSLSSMKGELAAGAAIRADALVPKLQAMLAAGLKSTPELTYGTPVVSLEEQAVLLSVPVSGTLAQAHIRYTGRIGAAGVIALSAGKLYYRILLTALTIDTIEHTGGTIGIAQFAWSINDLLTQLIPYANAALDKTAIDLPLPQFAPVSLSTPDIQVTPDKLVISPLGDIALVPRVNPSGLRMLAFEVHGASDKLIKSVFDIDLNRANLIAAAQRPSAAKALNPLRIANTKSSVDPSALEQAFSSKWASAGLPPAWQTPQAPSYQAFVSTAWAISSVNHTIVDNHLSASIRIDSGEVTFDSGKLSITGDLHTNCGAPRDCSRGACTRGGCSRDSCDYNCTRCAFGICVDDPICKAGETACNIREEGKVAACNTAEEARVAACNIAEEAKFGACNVQRNLEMAGCAIAQGVVDAIKNLDGIGSFSGGTRAHGSATVADPAIKFNQASQQLVLEMTPSASVRVDGSLHFQPYDIGHLLVCPTPGTVPFTVQAVLGGSRSTMIAQLTARPSTPASPLTLELTFAPVHVQGQISPAPLDAITIQNPQIFVTCNPVLTGVLPTIGIIGKVSAFTSLDIIGAIERAIPGDQSESARALKTFTSGVVDETVPLPAMRIDVPTLTAEIAGEKLMLFPSWVNGNLIYTQFRSKQ
jgi:hypothetical protein